MPHGQPSGEDHADAPCWQSFDDLSLATAVRPDATETTVHTGNGADNLRSPEDKKKRLPGLGALCQRADMQVWEPAKSGDAPDPPKLAETLVDHCSCAALTRTGA